MDLNKDLNKIRLSLLYRGLYGKPYISALSYHIFGGFYPVVQIGWNNKGIPELLNNNETFLSEISCNNKSETAFRPLSFEDEQCIINYLKKISINYFNVISSSYSLYETIIFTNHIDWIVGISTSSFDSLYVTCKDKSFISELLSNLPTLSTFEEDPAYYYVTYGDGSFDSNLFHLVNNYDVDIQKNFNDDLPIDEIYNFCTKDDCGLVLFHGLPGCGKTTLIKSLINKFSTDLRFYLMDASLLGNITSDAFLSYLMDHKNTVFILEDCEKLLMDRNTRDNPLIGTLLNLTDGMLGEGLCIRFICTFNADINSIDKALLREGRLDICYEFKPLCLEKSKVLCEELGKPCTKPMTLAEIYKSKHLSSTLKVLNKNKVGF